ncbi:MAG: hypothetical protein AAF329_05750, partial [Cyanobacteria bacterium P01_A01_bin.17]
MNPEVKRWLMRDIGYEDPTYPSGQRTKSKDAQYEEDVLKWSYFQVLLDNPEAPADEIADYFLSAKKIDGRNGRPMNYSYPDLHPGMEATFRIATRAYARAMYRTKTVEPAESLSVAEVEQGLRRCA